MYKLRPSESQPANKTTHTFRIWICVVVLPKLFINNQLSLTLAFDKSHLTGFWDCCYLYTSFEMF